jgi:hypothetical protein
MADAPDIPRPSQLWKQLDPDRKRQAADAFWRDENAANEQAEAIGLIAQRIKFRLKSVITMPVEKKSQYVLAMPAVSEMLAARLLVAYHLAHQRPMMGAFLDALGIANDDGRIDSDTTEVPAQDAAAVKKAADALAATYPVDEVATYFLTLLLQDASVWSGAIEWLKARALTATPAT